MKELQHWDVAVTVAPTLEPVTVAEAKDFIRETDAAQDSVISRMISAARRTQEKSLGRCLLTQTLVLSMSAFPCDEIVIPRSPVQSITSITYVDIDGVTQTLYDADNTANVQIDLRSTLCRITHAYLGFWPLTRCVPNAVTVTFVAGYGSVATAVPEDLVNALLMRVSDMYENRESKVTGTVISANDTLFGLEDNYRVDWYY